MKSFINKHFSTDLNIFTQLSHIPVRNAQQEKSAANYLINYRLLTDCITHVCWATFQRTRTWRGSRRVRRPRWSSVVPSSDANSLRSSAARAAWFRSIRPPGSLPQESPRHPRPDPLDRPTDAAGPRCTPSRGPYCNCTVQHQAQFSLPSLRGK